MENKPLSASEMGRLGGRARAARMTPEARSEAARWASNGGRESPIPTLGCVYGLVDPRDGEVRYVGSTTRPPETRLRQHIFSAHRRAGTADMNGVSSWILELSSLQIHPIVKVLRSDVPIEDLLSQEGSEIGSRSNLLNCNEPSAAGAHPGAIPKGKRLRNQDPRSAKLIPVTFRLSAGERDRVETAVGGKSGVNSFCRDASLAAADALIASVIGDAASTKGIP